tara:strand:+ start:13535 stop:13912 length:378 start_codon:yes stop_codon:yes gene_type:complete
MKIIKLADADDNELIEVTCVCYKKTGKITFEVTNQTLGAEGCLKIDADGNPLNHGLIRYFCGIVGINPEEILSTVEGEIVEGDADDVSLPSAFEVDQTPTVEESGDDDDIGVKNKVKQVDLGWGV